MIHTDKINTEARLVEVLGQAQEYLDLAIQAPDDEREFYKRIMDLYLNIARELEHLSGRRPEDRDPPSVPMTTA